MKNIKKRNTLFLILADKEKPAGFFIGKIEKLSRNGCEVETEKIGYIENVFITKKFRGKGNFSELIKIFFEYLKKREVKYCSLHVDINNKPAIGAYKKLNFFIQEYKMIAKIN
ncbi:GNAT family N-acetyltransferase, partial [Candidatus Woesearchaeota archaeon]|nr:GNAT family N-acetyltransferase [Candidatus Woesearchaeota archaeon]